MAIWSARPVTADKAPFLDSPWWASMSMYSSCALARARAFLPDHNKREGEEGEERRQQNRRTRRQQNQEDNKIEGQEDNKIRRARGGRGMDPSIIWGRARPPTIYSRERRRRNRHTRGRVSCLREVPFERRHMALEDLGGVERHALLQVVVLPKVAEELGRHREHSAERAVDGVDPPGVFLGR